MKVLRGALVLLALVLCAASPQDRQSTAPRSHAEGAIAADLIWEAKPLKWYERWMTSREEMTCPEEGLCYRKTSTLVCAPLNGVPSCTNTYEACSLLWIEEQDQTHTVASFWASELITLSFDTDLRKLSFYSPESSNSIDGLRTIVPKCNAMRDRCQQGRCMTVGQVVPAYDRLARAQGPQGPQTAPISTNGDGKWQVEIQKNPVDDTKTVTLSLDADSGVSRYGHPISLILRCKSHKTESYINWDAYLGSEATVLARIGSAKAVSQGWSLSSDSKATFYPGNHVSFIKSLLKADKLVAQVTPYDESPVTAVFDLSGLSTAISPLQEMCGWSPAAAAEESLKKDAEAAGARAAAAKNLVAFCQMIRWNRCVNEDHTLWGTDALLAKCGKGPVWHANGGTRPDEAACLKEGVK